MTVRVGHASMSENSSANGTKGDQTGKEVKINNWYSDSWTYMFIHPDANVREKHAKAVEDGCNNPNIGYGQSDRNTLYQEAKKVGMDLSKIKNVCNCDCSAFQNVCAVISGAPGITYGSNGWTVSSMINLLGSLGYKVITNTKYLRSADYCVRGAIIAKSGHTVCALDNGSKYQETLAAAGLSGSSSTTKPSTSTPSISNTDSLNLKIGDIVEFTGTTHYANAAASTGPSCKPGQAKITAIAKGKAHPYHLIAVSGGGSNVYGWVNTNDIKVIQTSVTGSTATHYTVKVSVKNLNIRTGPGTNYAVNGKVSPCPVGVYTIVEEANGPGASKWGKLKSGVGWISLDYTEKT